MVAADRYTAISAGFGALMGAKRMPPLSAVAFTVGMEALSQFAERRNPGVTGGDGGHALEKSVLDIGATLLAFWAAKSI